MSEYDDKSVWLPDPKVAKRYGVSLMALYRWDKAKIGFPPPAEDQRQELSQRAAASRVRRATQAQGAEGNRMKDEPYLLACSMLIVNDAMRFAGVKATTGCDGGPANRFYLQKVASGKHRHNLDGNDVADIEPEHAKGAAGTIARKPPIAASLSPPPETKKRTICTIDERS